jgi:hypothetical protein
VRNTILASTAAVLALLVAHVADPAAQGRQRNSSEGLISEGIPKMPNPPGPAPKRDMSGAWVGPATTNKPDPVPAMTPAGEKAFKERKGYGVASGNFGRGQQAAGVGESNDPFITCDPLGFPRNLIAHAITSRGGTLFGSARLARDLHGRPRPAEGRRREGRSRIALLRILGRPLGERHDARRRHHGPRRTRVAG